MELLRCDLADSPPSGAATAVPADAPSVDSLGAAVGAAFGTGGVVVGAARISIAVVTVLGSALLVAVPLLSSCAGVAVGVMSSSALCLLAVSVIP